MFTINDICNIAVQIERNGEAAYRQAAEKAKDPKIEAIFTQMADEEHCHGQWFEALSVERAVASNHQEMEAMGRALLQDMVKDQTFSLEGSTLSKTEKIEAIISQSIRFEEDTVNFYEMLSDFVDDRSVQKVLEVVIEEERQHIVKLRRLSEITPP